MTSSSNFMSVIEKLDGRDNFSTWKFAVQSLLEHEGLWDCVLGRERDPVKDTKARTKIALLVKPINYVHIEKCTTAKETWDKLAAAFADTGLMRRVSLIGTLTTTRLEDSTNVEAYVNAIISSAHKLHGIGCQVDDMWVASFLLAGLPDMYSPMIMAIESSGIALTSDSIKSKLLQEIKNSHRHVSSQALYTRRGPRCYECNAFGHKAINCRNKKMSSTSKVSISEERDEGKACSGVSFASGPRYATGFLARALTSCVSTSGCEYTSGKNNRSWLAQKSPRKKTSECYDFVNLDDLLSVKQNSNLGGDDQIVNSNSDVTSSVNLDLNSRVGQSNLNVNSDTDRSQNLNLIAGNRQSDHLNLNSESDEDQNLLELSSNLLKLDLYDSNQSLDSDDSKVVFEGFPPEFQSGF